VFEIRNFPGNEHYPVEPPLHDVLLENRAQIAAITKRERDDYIQRDDGTWVPASPNSTDVARRISSACALLEPLAGSVRLDLVPALVFPPELRGTYFGPEGHVVGRAGLEPATNGL
jgi:hypothetical protein